MPCGYEVSRGTPTLLSLILGTLPTPIPPCGAAVVMLLRAQDGPCSAPCNASMWISSSSAEGGGGMWTREILCLLLIFLPQGRAGGGRVLGQRHSVGSGPPLNAVCVACCVYPAHLRVRSPHSSTSWEGCPAVGCRTGMSFRANLPGSQTWLCHLLLSDLRQVTALLWASVSSSAKWGCLCLHGRVGEF